MRVREQAMLGRVVEINSIYNMFAPGQRLGVAVSGGADSTALLHVLVRLKAQWNLRLEVLHLNHGLRGEESEEDARFVEAMSRGLGLPMHLRRVDLRGASENLEHAARQARLDFLLGFVREGKLDRVATGHTRSDQAETVLFRILRGSGPAGLAAILPVTAEGLVRPLLGVDREEVRAWLLEQGIAWRTDSSNQSLEFSRNRIRAELLPLLRRDWNPALDEALSQMSVLAREDEEYWVAVIPEVAGRALRMHDGAAYFLLDKFSGFPRAVQRRLLRHAVQMVKGDLLGVEFGHLKKMLELARGPDGHGRMQVPGADVVRSMDWLRISPLGMESFENRDFRVALVIPGEVPEPGWRIRLKVQILEGDYGYNEVAGDIDGDRVTQHLALRNWRPGDKMLRQGQQGEKSLKELFQQARIPLWNRRKWPIIEDGDKVIWARQFGVDARFAAGPGTRRALRISEEHQ